MYTQYIVLTDGNTLRNRFDNKTVVLALENGNLLIVTGNNVKYIVSVELAGTQLK